MKKTWIRIVMVCLAMLVLLPIWPLSGFAAEEKTFTDIPGDFWAKDAIDYMSEKGYLMGKEDGSFGPTEVITRKTVAMLLYRFEGQPEINGSIRFTDVKRDRYYAAILWANRAGIINGYADNTFHPNDIISRQHFAAMLYRYVQYKGSIAPGDAQKQLTAFSDFEAVYGWAVDECQWAYSNGLITGRTETVFDPQGNTTRAQLAVIMTRLLENIFAGAPASVPAVNPVTRDPWDMDYSQSMVDSGWFDDVLFIGDSRTTGLRDYARNGNADYFCTVGLNVFDAPYTYTSDLNFARTNLSGLLSQKQYGKIFINLGINECGYSHSSVISAYSSLVSMIRAAQPDAKIILMSVLTCGRGKAAELWCFEPDNIYALNERIAALADYETVFYVDMNTAFADNERYLPDAVSSDGCHFYLTYYQRWSHWIGYIAAQMGL